MDETDILILWLRIISYISNLTTTLLHFENHRIGADGLVFIG